MKIFYHLSILTLFMAVVLLIGWFFPTIIVKKPYGISPHEVKQGGEVVFTSDYCKLLPLSARYTIAFVGIRKSDGVLIRKPVDKSFVSNAPVGCAKGNFSVDVPETLSPGEYHIELTTIFYPMPRSFTFKSEEFIVTEGETSIKKLDEILSILDQWDLIE